MRTISQSQSGCLGTPENPWHLETVTDWTGGTSADLDAIVTTTRRVGIVTSFVEANSSALFAYTLTTGTDAENVPHVVRPDDYNASTNAKVWKLRSVHKNGSVCLYNATDEKWHPLTAAISTTTVATSLDQTGFFAPLNPILSGSLGYWKLDESAPSGDVSARDMVGSTHLTSNNSVLSTTGKVANGRLFVAANSERLSAAAGHPFAFGDQSFTAAAWVKLTSKPANVCFITGVYNGVTNNRCWTLLWDNSLDRFRMLGSATGTAVTGAISSSIGAPTIGAWYFIVGGYDAANDVLFISVNGGAADTVALSGGLFGSASAEFLIGAANNGGANTFLDATVDEVGIWNRRLTTDEITELYNTPGLP